MATNKHDTDTSDESVHTDDTTPAERNVDETPTKARNNDPQPARRMPSAMGATFAERAKAAGERTTTNVESAEKK